MKLKQAKLRVFWGPIPQKLELMREATQLKKEPLLLCPKVSQRKSRS